MTLTIPTPGPLGWTQQIPFREDLQTCQAPWRHCIFWEGSPLNVSLFSFVEGVFGAFHLHWNGWITSLSGLTLGKFEYQ